MIINSFYKNIPLNSLIKAAYSSGKINVPVKESQYPYARFKHIAGFPPSPNGVSINKLKSIDALIERINRLENRRQAQVKIESSIGLEKGMNIEAEIEKYSSLLHKLAVDNSSPFTGSFKETGVLLNTTA